MTRVAQPENARLLANPIFFIKSIQVNHMSQKNTKKNSPLPSVLEDTDPLNLLAIFDDMEEQAAIRTPEKHRKNAWTASEVITVHGLVCHALKKKDKKKLEQIIDFFGGTLPLRWPKEYEDLFYMACKPQSVGFEQIFKACEKEALIEFNELKQTSVLANDEEFQLQWLSKGLVSRNDLMDGDTIRINVREQTCPISACFAQDNARALSWILKDPTRREIVAKLEPKNAFKPDFSARYCSKEGRIYKNNPLETDAAAETSLMHQSLNTHAYRCFLWLMKEPHFAKALEPETLGLHGKYLHMNQTSEWPLNTESKEEYTIPDLYFELMPLRMIQMFNKKLDYFPSNRHYLKDLKARTDCFKLFWTMAPESVKTWKSSGGVAWSEIFMLKVKQEHWFRTLTSYPDRLSEHQEQCKAVLDVILTMKEVGCNMDWDRLSEGFKEVPVLSEWIVLNATIPTAIPTESSGHKNRL